MRITRDSLVLWFGIIASIVAALASNLDMLPTALIPYKEWIMFASVIVGSLSGKLATSPLKGEND